LKSQLKSANRDSNKVKLLLNLGDAYQFDNNDLVASKSYYRRAGILSRQLRYNAGILEYLFDYSDALAQQGKYDSSLAMNQEARAIAAKEMDSAQLVRALFNMGVCYDGLRNPQQGIRYILQARDYYEKKEIMARVGMCDNELMLLFLNAKNYPEAIHYGKEAIPLYKRYRPERKLSTPIQNLAVVYQSMQQPIKAVPLLKEALSIDRRYHRESAELDVLINLVDLKFHTGDLKDAKAYIDRILHLSRKLKIDEGVCDGQLNMARYYMRRNQLSKAENYADSALQVARDMKSQDLKRECYSILSHVAYAGHHYEKALKFDSEIDLAQEAINTADINHSLIELQTKYQTEKKTAQIKQLQAQQQLQKLSIQKKRIYMGIMIVVIVAFICIGFLYYRNYKRKQRLLIAEQQLQQQKIIALEQEKVLLATEAVLKGQDEERSRLAKDLHDGLGGILSSAKYSLDDMKDNVIITPENAAAFERTMGMLDKSISELRRVAHNMMPESLMNQSLSEALRDTCHQVTASGALSVVYNDFGMNETEPDNQVKITVYRVVQELLNNSIKHALATHAIVQLIAKDKTLHITVEDNGRGFDTGILDEADGLGYKNIKSRIAYLKGNVDIQSVTGKGTSVYIEIPR